MSKIFRVSGYLVDKEEKDDKESIENILNDKSVAIYEDELWQQLHIEESESFELDGEDEENCDLALLTRHFKKDIQEGLERKVVVGGNYRHFKEGKIVKVIGISRHTETQEVTVVYEYEGTIWNRPIEMFLSEVDHEKYPITTQEYRFELIEELKPCPFCKGKAYLIKTLSSSEVICESCHASTPAFKGLKAIEFWNTRDIS